MTAAGQIRRRSLAQRSASSWRLPLRWVWPALLVLLALALLPGTRRHHDQG